MRKLPIFAVCALAFLLAACGIVPTAPKPEPAAARRPPASGLGREIILYALGLIDVGYRFGGKNPEAGLDCSGMVTYVFKQAAGMKLDGSAATIARRGRSINRKELRPGDLVFFNTRNAPFSHVGIYIGDDRFIHAPSTNGRVRIESMKSRYFAQRFHAARAYFD
ncbi:MAG: C40 family peptidase [Candidatus Accumulibacter sp.]|jgi:cell wall-associated NlpC family hydrolase|nr:C40 family peptidase [Accumulibacter sp.]